MKNLSFTNKILFFVNSLFLVGQIFSYLAPFISPSIFWPIAFFGLFFPIFLLINGIFLIYWTIITKKQFWANLLIFLIGFNSITSFIGKGENKKVESVKNELSILSYNVRLFNAYNWIKKDDVEKKIIDFLKQTDSDILCIQEFYAPNKLPGLNYPFKHIGIQNKKSQWHMAIYSRYQQINKSTISIYGEHMNNTCIFSDIIINKDTFRVFNIHLASNWFGQRDYDFIKNPTMNKKVIKEGFFRITSRLKKSFIKRAVEVDVIKEHMNNSPFPIIICGDFNDTPNSYAYKKISHGLKDSFLEQGIGIGSTFLGKIPFLRIDYILHSPRLKTNTFTTYKEKLSDHKAIESKISL